MDFAGSQFVESAGPKWRLLGLVQLPRYPRRTLSLTRAQDALSGKIRAMAGRAIPEVLVRGSSVWNGHLVTTATLTCAVVVAIEDVNTYPSSGVWRPQHPVVKQEIIQFLFQKIQVVSTNSVGILDHWAIA